MSNDVVEYNDHENDKDAEIASLKKKLRNKTVNPNKSAVPKWAAPVGMVIAAGALGLGYFYTPNATQSTNGVGLPTSQSSEFQQGGGLDGFTITQDKAPVAVDTNESEEAAKLRALVESLEDDIAKLRANPEQVIVADEQALTLLKTEIAALQERQAEKDAQARELENELLRMQSQIETDALLAEDQNAEALRRAELERRRAEAKAIEDRQINSAMVTQMSGSSSSGDDSRDYSADEQFLRGSADETTVIRSQVVFAPSNTVLQGTMIEASLTSAALSSTAGEVTATVSYDVWSADVSQVLIPRGSKLIGRYNNSVDIGQKRLPVAWDRIITPDFQSVLLDAHGTDRLGRSGASGRVNNHFFERFGSAALISIIGAVPSVLADNTNNDTASDTAENVGEDLAAAVDTVVSEYLSISPTIAIDQGDIVMVRVNADIELF